MYAPLLAIPAKLAKPTTFKVEPRVTAPLTEAVPPTSKVWLALVTDPREVKPVASKLDETDTPPVKVLRAVQVLAVDLEAGPLVQSNLTMVSAPEAVRLKALLAKLMIVEAATD